MGGELKVKGLMEQVKDSQEDSLDYVNNHGVEDRPFKERLIQEDGNTREETGESLPNINEL